MCTCRGTKLFIIPRRKRAMAMKNTAAAGPNTKERMSHLRRNSSFTGRSWVACHDAIMIIHVDWNSFRAMAQWKNLQDGLAVGYFLKVPNQISLLNMRIVYNLRVQNAADKRILEA